MLTGLLQGYKQTIQKQNRSEIHDRIHCDFLVGLILWNQLREWSNFLVECGAINGFAPHK